MAGLQRGKHTLNVRSGTVAGVCYRPEVVTCAAYFDCPTGHRIPECHTSESRRFRSLPLTTVSPWQRMPALPDVNATNNCRSSTKIDSAYRRHP